VSRLRNAAEQRDELAPFLIELHSIPSSHDGVAGYRIREE
jgi:hypothetical protein